MGKVWKPLVDGDYVHDSTIDGRIMLRISDNGEDLRIFGPDEMYESIYLSPFSVRLCQLVTVPDPAPTVPLTPQLREALGIIVRQMEDYVEDGYVADEGGENSAALTLVRQVLGGQDDGT